MISKTKRFKFFVERKFTLILLWVFTFISLILIIKTSNDPVIGCLKGSFIERYLYQFSFANSFICDISIGFLVSVVFYLIVVYIPDKQKKRDIGPFIENKCESLVFSSYALIHEIISKSNMGFQYKTLTKEQFVEICKNVNPKEHKYNFANSIINITQNHLGYKIYNDWMRIVNEIDDILRLLPYLDSGLLKRIYVLYNNFLRYVAKDLAVVENLNNNNLEAWSDTLYSFYLATKDLRDYYRMYSKSEFKNDPWK